MTPGRMIALFFLACVFIMEGYDINAMALAVPRLEDSLGLGAGSFGWVFTALLVGIGIGGAFLAPYGDRFGRRTLIVLGCLATGIFTVATTTSSTITEFILWRGLTGIALGAALPNVSALSAELAPDKARATVMAVVSAGIPLGLAIAGIMAPEVIALGGWQGLFYVPGVFAIAIAAILQFILEGGAPAGVADKPAKDGAAASAATGEGLIHHLARAFPQLRVILPPWWLPFSVFAAILAINALNLYLLSSWIPTVLPQAGFSLDAAARVAGIVQLAGLGIGILASIAIDRWNKSITLVSMFGAMALCFLAVSMTAAEPSLWTILLCVGVGGASAGGMVLPGLCVYLFAPRLLSSAIGLGVLVARIGAFMGPPIGQAILNANAGPNTFFFAAFVPAALCAVLALLVPMALAVKKREEAREEAEEALA